MVKFMLAVVILIAVGLCTYVLAVKKRRDTRNVAVLKHYKRRKKRQGMAEQPESPHRGTEGQKCSHCGKQAKRITFYAEESGTVIGLCSACKPIAQRRDLMPL